MGVYRLSVDWDFEVRLPAKWVLAGEHSVLRGGLAVVLPHPEFSLQLRYRQGEPGTARQFTTPEAHSVVASLLQQAERLDPSLRLPESGTFWVKSTIPTGAGLGSSAAFCVAVARWIEAQGVLPPAQLFEFARSLEDHFHGTSSGMDVAAVLAGEPASFTRSKGAEPLGVGRLPRFTFHDLGVRASTRDCVEKVQALLAADPEKGQALDGQMSSAAHLARLSLVREDWRGLAQAMDQAQGCFRQWGLLPPEALDLEGDLRARGALSVKITGAGGGGFLVALWPSGG